MTYAGGRPPRRPGVGKERIEFMDNLELGKYGESLAVRYLRLRGYRILERNFTCMIGEIDIIAKRMNTIIFVEVKSRTSIEYGQPKEYVLKKKQRKLRNLAWFYIKKNSLYDYNFRLDVISIHIKNNGFFKKAQVEMIKNAFEVGGDDYVGQD